jgi:NADPH:quinone reductase-like Zn-dependent oxidoreductase
VWCSAPDQSILTLEPDMVSAMRAWVVEDSGDIDALRLGRLPHPVCGSGQIRIDVHRAAIDFPDLLMVAGRYQVRPEPPFARGFECAGVVTEVGPGVDELAVGDRVAAGMWSGRYAEEAVVDARRAWRIPDSMPFSHAAVLYAAHFTAAYALGTRGSLRPCETVAVTGATGGVARPPSRSHRRWGRGRSRSSGQTPSGRRRSTTARRPLSSSVTATSDARSTWRPTASASTSSWNSSVAGRSSRYSEAWRGEAACSSASAVDRDPHGFGRAVSSVFDWYTTGAIRPKTEDVPFDGTVDALRSLRDRAVAGKLVLAVRG